MVSKGKGKYLVCRDHLTYASVDERCSEEFVHGKGFDNAEPGAYEYVENVCEQIAERLLCSQSLISPLAIVGIWST